MIKCSSKRPIRLPPDLKLRLIRVVQVLWGRFTVSPGYARPRRRCLQTPTMSAFAPSLPLRLQTHSPPTIRRTVKRRPASCNATKADVDVAIIGGGVGGLAAALSLRQAGRSATVFERSAADDSQGQAVGLWTNAWRALSSLGAPLDVLRASYANTEAQIFRTDGTLVRRIPICQFNGAPAEFRYVLRGDLLEALQAPLPPGCVQKGTTVMDVRAVGDIFEITVASGQRFRARAVVGADGVRSVVREVLLGLPIPARYAGYRAYRGSSLAPPQIAEAIRPRRVLQVWGVGERFGATLLDDERIHWFYTLAEDAATVAGDARTPDEQLAFVRDVVAKWKIALPGQIARLPEQEFAVTRCGDRFMPTPTWGKGACTLLGDAAHLSTPNLGQGAALALEDAVELGFQVSKVGGKDASAEEIGRAMRMFERRRWARNLEVGIRSAGVGVLVHLDNAALVWARNNVLAPVLMNEKVMLGTTGWSPPQ